MWIGFWDCTPDGVRRISAILSHPPPHKPNVRFTVQHPNAFIYFTFNWKYPTSVWCRRWCGCSQKIHTNKEARQLNLAWPGRRMSWPLSLLASCHQTPCEAGTGIIHLVNTKFSLDMLKGIFNWPSPMTRDKTPFLLISMVQVKTSAPRSDVIAEGRTTLFKEVASSL